MSKKLERKLCMYIQTYYVHAQIFRQKELFCVPYKKDKFMYEYMTIYGTYFFYLFYRWHINVLFCQKLVWGY
jgi:hypothetical protein